MIQKWLSPLRSLLGVPGKGRTIRRRPLKLEPLEERRVLSTLLGDDLGDTFNTAFPVTLAAQGQTSLTGQLDRNDDVDVLILHSQRTGGQSVRLLGLARNTVDFKLEAFDRAGNMLATNDNSGGTTDPTVTFDAQENSDYYIRITGQNATPLQTPVNYVVQATPYQDDYLNLPSGPPITLTGSSTQTFDGQIETLEDVDAFRFRATTGGGVVFTLSAATGSNLDSYLTVTDSRGAVIGQSDNINAGTQTARVAALLRAGETYTVTASASPFAIPTGTTGAYRLSAQPFVDEAGTFREDAGVLTLNAQGTGSASATIGAGGDSDAFRFTANQTGIFLIQVTPTNSTAVPTLSLANDIDSFIGTQVDARTIRFEARMGDEFLARVGGDGSATFAYQVQVQPIPNDGDNTIGNAVPVTLDSAGSAQTRGRIDFAGDIDFLRVDSRRAGFLKVAVTSDSASFHPVAQAFDASRRLIQGPLDLVTFPIRDQQIYYLGISANDRSQGSYSVSITTEGDTVPNTILEAPTLDLSGGSVVRDDRIDTVGDIDIYRLVAPSSGTFTIHLDSINGPDGVGDPVLTILDSRGNVIALNDDSDGLDSRLDLPLTQGEIIFVQAGAFASVRGDYRLSIQIRSLIDQVGNTLADAPLLTFDSAQQLVHEDSIESQDQGDLFKFVAPISGDYLLQLNAVAGPTGLSDPVLTVLNSQGSTIGENDDSDGLNSRLTLRLTAGETYYARARGVGTLTGDYRLSINALNPPTPSNALTTSRPILLNSLGTTIQSGTIRTPGASELFRFTAPFTGRLRIRQEATATSQLDSTLTILTTSGAQLKQDNDSGGSLNSDLILDVEAGTSYLVQAAGYRTTIGSYRLIFERAADILNDTGNKRSEAEEVILDSNRSLVVQSSIDNGGDFDWYVYTATESGYLEVSMEANQSGVDAVLSVFDDSGNLDTDTGRFLVENDDSGEGFNSSLSLQVVTGTTYYIRASAYQQTLGNYRLSFSLSQDDVGDTPADSLELSLTNQRASFDGTLRPMNDQDVFRFTAPATGSYLVREFATGTSVVAPLMEWIDADGNTIQQSFPINPAEAQFTVSANAGETLYILATRTDLPESFTALNSAYRLTIVPILDDAPNRLTQATPIVVSGDGGGATSGRLEVTGDVDFYQFVAPISGTYDLRMVAALGSAIDSQLDVYDAQGNVLGRNDDIAEIHSIDSRILFRAVAGETYFIQAAASRGTNITTTTGEYRLLIQRTIDPQDLRSIFNTAPRITLNGTGTGSSIGSLLQIGARGTDSFVSPVTGSLTITVSPSPGSPLDPRLSVFRFNRTTMDYDLVGRNDNRAMFGDLASEVTINALAGESYFLLIDSTAVNPTQRLGNYQIAVAPSSNPYLDDYGFAPSAATVLTLDSRGRASLQGQIETIFDEDRFRFTPSTSGDFLLYRDNSSSLQTRIQVLDSSGNPLRPVGRREGQVDVYALQAGRRYDFLIGANANFDSLLDQPNSTGSYSFVLRRDGDDVPNTFMGAVSLVQERDGSASTVGFLENPLDLDRYRFVASTTGELTIDLGRFDVDGNQLDTLLTVFDANGNQLARNDDRELSTRDSRVILNVVQGQTYFIQTEAADNRGGLYQLSVSAVDPIGGNTLADAQTIHLDQDLSFVVDTTLSTDSDVDTFRFVAPSSGTIRFRMSGIPREMLSPDLTIYTDSVPHAGLLTADPLAVETVLQVTQGEIITLVAGSFQQNSHGSYRLTGTYADIVDLPSNSTVTRESGLSRDLPVQRYEVTPQMDGIVTVIVEPRNALDPLQTTVMVLSSDFKLLSASSDDYAQRGTQLQFLVRANQRYYIDVSALEESLGISRGDYRVRFQFGTNGLNRVASPTVIQTISPSNNSITAAIPLPGTSQVQSYTATSSGTMTVEFYAQMSLNVSVFDSQNRLISSYTAPTVSTTINSTVSDSSGSSSSSSSLRSQLTFNTTARDTYYIRVSTPDTMPATQSAYSLQIRPDDAGGDMGSSTSVSLNRGSGSTSGTVNTSGDVDFYRSVSTVNGAVTIRFQDAPGLRLNGNVQVFDSAGNLLGSGDQLATVNLTSGQEFFVRVSATETGKYDLAFDSVANNSNNGGATDNGGAVGSPPSVSDPTADTPGSTNVTDASNSGGSDSSGSSSTSTSTSTSNTTSTAQGLALFGNDQSFSDRELANAQNILNIGSLEGTAELLVAVLLVGPDAENSGSTEEDAEGNEENLPSDSEEALLLRLNSLADQEVVRSLRGMLDAYLQKLYERFQLHPSPELNELIALLNTPEGREMIENARNLLGVIDSIRKNVPSVGVPIQQFLDLWQQWYPEGIAPAQHPNAVPTPLDDLLIPDPVRQSKLPGESQVPERVASGSDFRYLLIALAMLGMASLQTSTEPERKQGLKRATKPIDPD